MPELPEVQTIVNEMREASLIGLNIVKTETFWDRSIANQTPLDFSRRIANQTILNIDRKGKFIVFSLSHDTLLVHLRMTGKFFINAKKSLPTSHERIRLHLSDGRILRFEDQRKFGKWYLANSDKLLEKIGIEPLSPNFTLTAFKNILKGHRRQIKPFLLDQHFIAGLGNIYTDEALWSAKIHPSRHTESLTNDELKMLHQAIITVLQKGIKNTGTTLGNTRANYFSISGRRGTNQHKLNVFRRNGKPCPRCGTTIQKIVLAQRGTHFCPHCQING